MFCEIADVCLALLNSHDTVLLPLTICVVCPQIAEAQDVLLPGTPHLPRVQALYDSTQTQTEDTLTQAAERPP